MTLFVRKIILDVNKKMFHFYLSRTHQVFEIFSFFKCSIKYGFYPISGVVCLFPPEVGRVAATLNRLSVIKIGWWDGHNRCYLNLVMAFGQSQSHLGSFRHKV